MDHAHCPVCGGDQAPRSSLLVQIKLARGCSGIRGLGFNYVVWEYEYGAELYIDRRVLGDGAEAENRKIFDQLYSQRQKVETAVGGPIEWETFEGKRVCRIRIREDGGWKSPEESWPEIQDQIIKTMD